MCLDWITYKRDFNAIQMQNGQLRKTIYSINLASFTCLVQNHRSQVHGQTFYYL